MFASRFSRAAAALALATVLVPHAARAQRLVALDASAGADAGGQRVAVSAWLPLTSILDRLTISGGARLTTYTGDGGLFTNRGTRTGALAPTLAFPTNVVGLALAVQAELAVVGPLSVGFNIDVGGIALGGDQRVSGLTPKVQRGSLLLGGTPDVGALNSETYVAWAVVPTVTVRAGTTHYVTNYDVTDAAASGAPTAKYQSFRTVPFVAVSWRF